MSFLDDAISTIGQGLAQTAISEASDATGLNVGGALQSLFGDGQATGGVNLATITGQIATDWTGGEPGLSVISDNMTQQTQMIGELGNRLDSIATAISQISGQIANIEALLQALNKAQLYTEWSVVDTPISTVTIPAIQTAYDTYGSFIAEASGTESSEVSSFLQDVLAPQDGFDAMMAGINAATLDSDQRKGLLQLWSNMVAPLILAGSIDYREAVQEYFSYYSKLAYAQLQAVNLLMEAHNYNPTGGTGNPDAAKLAWADYRGYILAQEQPFIHWLIPLVMAGATEAQFNVPTYSNVHAAMQLDAGVQLLTGGSGSYYEASPIFRAAEQLLATLYVTAPDARRIVVHVLWADYPPITALVQPTVFQLVAPDGTTTFNPARRSTMGPFSWSPSLTNWVPDTNLPIVLGLYVKRMVYAAGTSGDSGIDPLADQSYSLQNPAGLQPMETYTSWGYPIAAFSAAALANQMYVDGSQQFDFMNVVAYGNSFATMILPPAASLR